MAKNNHKCIVCGTEYRYCPNCIEFDKMPRWMSLFCGQNCHDVFQVACDFENGDISKEDAIKELGKLDISKRVVYHGSLKNTVDKIFEKNVEKRVEPTVKTVEKYNVDNKTDTFSQVNKQFKNFNKKK